jgi:dienelactone hydrolase
MKAALFSLLAAAGSASAALVEKSVEYRHEGATLEGLLVHDDAFAGKRPAVLVIHQWTGPGDYEKMRARMLAELGYNVLVADVYGKGVRPVPPAAGEEAGKYKADRALFRGRLLAGLALLRQDERSEPSKLAAIGYCFGGTGALELARAGVELAGVVSFHGGLDAADGMAAPAGGVKARLLVLHGAADPFVPDAQVAGFTKEMNAAGADWQLVSYGGAVHAFTQQAAGDDPTRGAAYHAAADRRSWQAMKSFFAEIFGR